MMVTRTPGILFPTADKGGKAGQEALPIVAHRAERVVKAAMAQAAIAHRGVRETAEEVAEVVEVGMREKAAQAVREVMARTAVL
jgi:hypothetical protein